MMRRTAVAAGALGITLGVVAITTMSVQGPFHSSIGPNILVNSVTLGECTSDLWYTQRRFNSQCWECNPILQAIGGPAGAWTYCGTPYIPFSTRSLPDEGGGTPAGVHFDNRLTGTHYSVFGEVTITVEEVAGTCIGGGCPVGTHAVLEVMQQNHQDGGDRPLAVGRIPCTAPVGTCVSTSPNAQNGCTTDAGIWGVVYPDLIGGPLHFEIKADGGQCSRFGVYRISGYTLPFAYGDGGGA